MSSNDGNLSCPRGMRGICDGWDPSSVANGKLDTFRERLGTTKRLSLLHPAREPFHNRTLHVPERTSFVNPVEKLGHKMGRFYVVRMHDRDDCGLCIMDPPVNPRQLRSLAWPESYVRVKIGGALCLERTRTLLPWRLPWFNTAAAPIPCYLDLEQAFPFWLPKPKISILIEISSFLDRY